MFLVLILLLVFIPVSSMADEMTNEELENLLSLSLEQLTEVVITSASKREEKLYDAPAAAFVLTDEDIRRSGATSIPEALRLVPGIQVARSNSHGWAVTARGFNDQIANKLLVLIDGRTVYTPLASGVYWDEKDYLLEDIARIEVIRGPGGTLWGANAVNGVINIITKTAENTQGNYVNTGFGNEEQGFINTRHGGALEDGFYRIYAKFNNRGETKQLNGEDHNDDWYRGQAGFRMDMDKTDKDNLTVQGDYYYGNKDNITKLPFPAVVPETGDYFELIEDDTEKFQGGNVLVRWDHEFSKNSNTSLQSYLDYTKRQWLPLDQEILTFDVDFQHNYKLSEINDITWGAGFRLINYDLQFTEYLSYEESVQNDILLSAFIQDKTTIVKDKLYLTIGSKFEHNDYTGFEFQPSAKVAWNVDENNMMWASVARAVRTPYRNMDDIYFASQGGPGYIVRLIGNDDAESEDLIAYELGYRMEHNNFSFDIATFYNDYDKLVIPLANPALNGFDPGSATFPPHGIVAFEAQNGGSGQTYGVEIAADWQVNEDWKLIGTYTFLHMNLEGPAGLVTTEGKNPEHQFNIRSHLNIGEKWQLDNILYYVSELEELDIPSYFRFDTRVGYKLNDNVEFAVVGQNLFDDWHQEFGPFLYNVESEIGRSVYGEISWKF